MAIGVDGPITTECLQDDMDTEGRQLPRAQADTDVIRTIGSIHKRPSREAKSITCKTVTKLYSHGSL